MSLDLEAGLDWRAKVELFEQIRREYEFGAGTIIGIARKLGVHRRTVREAVRSAMPARRKKIERPQVKMAAVSVFIDGILEADRKAPRKQRHTAKRIWERTREEVSGSTVAERTVRKYVERRKQELGYGRQDTFVPQSYEWGVEAQVDWYEAFADLDHEADLHRCGRERSSRAVFGVREHDEVGAEKRKSSLVFGSEGRRTRVPEEAQQRLPLLFIDTVSEAVFAAVGAAPR
jgi:hypothetical protein